MLDFQALHVTQKFIGYCQLLLWGIAYFFQCVYDSRDDQSWGEMILEVVEHTIASCNIGETAMMNLLSVSFTDEHEYVWHVNPCGEMAFGMAPFLTAWTWRLLVDKCIDEHLLTGYNVNGWSWQAYSFSH